MLQRFGDATRSRMEGIATTLNSTLRQMEGKPSVDVAILGYRLNAQGGGEIASRWGGAFAGRVWVSSSEFLSQPLRVEKRTRHAVDPITRMMTTQAVDFPVWFEGGVGAAALSAKVAFEYVADALCDWVSRAPMAQPPMVVSFLADLNPSESVAEAVVPLGRVATPFGYPLLLQFHAANLSTVPVVKYPASVQFLPFGPVQDLFYACSPLSPAMIQTLRENQETPVEGAKGLVYNGKMIELVRFMNLVKCYQNTLPPDQVAPTPYSAAPSTSYTNNPSATSATSAPVSPQVLTPFSIRRAEEDGEPFPSLLSNNTTEEIDKELAMDKIPPLSRNNAPTSGEMPPSGLVSLGLVPPGLVPPGVTPPGIGQPGAGQLGSETEPEESTEGAGLASQENRREEIIPDGFEFHCEIVEKGKSVSEPENLLPRATLFVVILDRSASDLTYRPALDAWAKRLDKTRFMLGEIARRGRGRYDAAELLYGKERSGETSVVNAFGELPFISDDCLGSLAGKVEPFAIQVPNGIGGLVALPRKKLVFTNATPTYAADPTPVFEKAAEIIRLWDEKREQKLLPPVILHVTAGEFRHESYDEAIAHLADSGVPTIWLHHWIFTERPHVGACCPGEMSFTTNEQIQFLWERTDPLPGREKLAGIRPGVHEESRGMMVNMDFDILFEVIDTLGKK